MTEQEKTDLQIAVGVCLNTKAKKENFLKKNFSHIDYSTCPIDYSAKNFTNWFVDNNMGGSLMADMNSDFNLDLTLTFPTTEV